MDNSYQLGRDIGFLQARVERLEQVSKNGCGCKGTQEAGSAALQESEMTETQKKNLAVIRENIGSIYETVNSILAKAGATTRLSRIEFSDSPSPKFVDCGRYPQDWCCCTNGSYKCPCSTCSDDDQDK